MSSADAAWLHMDRPANLMIINSVLWFDEPVDWDAYKAIVRERLVERFDRFRQRPVEGVTGPHWEDAEVDLDLHFHHVALFVLDGLIGFDHISVVLEAGAKDVIPVQRAVVCAVEFPDVVAGIQGFIFFSTFNHENFMIW
jgi:hypothetical protein